MQQVMSTAFASYVGKALSNPLQCHFIFHFLRCDLAFGCAWVEFHALVNRQDLARGGGAFRFDYTVLRALHPRRVHLSSRPACKVAILKDNSLRKCGNRYLCIAPRSSARL